MDTFKTIDSAGNPYYVIRTDDKSKLARTPLAEFWAWIYKNDIGKEILRPIGDGKIVCLTERAAMLVLLAWE